MKTREFITILSPPPNVAIKDVMWFFINLCIKNINNVIPF